jgi:hypothetical protein
VVTPICGAQSAWSIADAPFDSTMEIAAEKDGAELKVIVIVSVPASFCVMLNREYNRVSDPFETQAVAPEAQAVFE